MLPSFPFCVSPHQANPNPSTNSPTNTHVLFKTQGFVRAYSQILDHAAPSYRLLFQHLLQTTATTAAEPNGTLIHCTAGKDRTAVAVALLLSLLSLPTDAIAAEYALSEPGLAGLREKLAPGLLATGAFDGPDGSKDEAAVHRMLSARAENMVATLEAIREKYGGAEGYLTGVLGLSAEDVQRLRDRFVV